MKKILSQAIYATNLVVLLICLLRQVGNPLSLAHLFDPAHLGSVVGLEGAMVDIAQALTEQEADGDAYEEVRYQTLPSLSTFVLRRV